MFVLGADNTLPSTTDLIFGIGNGDTIGPTDVSGHNQTIRSIATNSTNTSATGVGNIYNLSIVNTVSSHSYSSNPDGNASDDHADAAQHDRDDLQGRHRRYEPGNQSI